MVSQAVGGIASFVGSLVASLDPGAASTAGEDVAELVKLQPSSKHATHALAVAVMAEPSHISASIAAGSQATNLET
jgi:hypothetical protein